ncbi:ABC transporter permease [Celeribacter indicus]|uniref:Binding-protein-dependent transport system inner membrane protein n=1 Tax=Celeribacter indicus TaxID=1208324 RepID=A0A0B5DRK7_9RHOB|nr:iron ABC transporter permease [Celeribacter indicus]AJE46153.1 binding-protein-dependent transport system inner membrane protein [Celeribacter indicus]SDX36725.1 iron(III) transport system permease protein [Celeribacter indicus]
MSLALSEPAAPRTTPLHRRRQRRLLLALVPTWIVLGVLFILPIVMLFVAGFRTSPLTPDAEWTTAALARLWEPAVHSAFAVSLLLGLSTTVAGIALATIFAFLSERSDAPFRRIITPAMLVMYATPTLFYALSFSLLANPYTGVLNDLARLVMGPGATPFNVESLAGLIFVTTFRVVAFAYIFIVAGFRAIDRTLEDASMISGVGRFGTLWRIDLPLLAPAITGAAIITVIAGLHTFDIAMVLAEPAGIRTVATQIYDITNRSMPPDFGSASLLGSVVVLLAMGLGYLQYRLLGGRSFVTVGGKGGNREPYRLGRGRWLAGLFILTYLSVVELLPILTLVFTTFQPFPGVYGELTLVHFQRVLAAPETRVALSNTVTLSVVVGAAATALAFWVASLAQGLSRRGATALKLAATIPFALPGVVAAIAITSAFISIPGLRQLYGTLTLMALALVIVVIPYAVQLATASLAQISPDLRQAAEIHGASPTRSFRDVTVPLVAPHFLFAWYITGVSVAGNLDVPLLLGGPGLTTVAARVFDLNLQGKVAQAAAMLLILLGLVVIAGIAGRVLLHLLRGRPAVTLNDGATA